MSPITEEYLVLFNAVTDAENALMNLYEKMVNAQRLAEELYINSEAVANLPKGEVRIVK